MKFDVESHVTNIDEAIDELSKLYPRTSSPAPLPHQYVGTVVDDTFVLLMAPANALDRGRRQAYFTNTENWLSLMQAVHRSFFASLHLATERGLESICEAEAISVGSSTARRFERELNKLTELISEEAMLKRLKRLAKCVPLSRPTFDDHLNAVLAWSKLPKDTKRAWRLFFQALSIVRNKMSHSDPSLSGKEKQKLLDALFHPMISNDGDLVANPRMYNHVVCAVLDFFDLLETRRNAI